MKDESEGVLPGVTVTVTNEDTGFNRSQVSDEGGRYRVPQLPLGNYRVRAELTGFRSTLRSGIQLTVGQEAVVDLTMALGEISEQEGHAPETAVVRREDGSLLMDGMMSVDDVKAELGLAELPEEGDYHTLAGLVLALAQRIPAEGDQVSWGGFRFEVMDMDQRRIDKVLVRPEPVATPDV